MNKAISLALLAEGILLIILGVRAAGSFSSDISRFFTDSPTDKAIWMLIGGAVLSISQAICLYREQQKLTGPLFLGIDTHALSVPACASALEMLAANGVDVMLAQGDDYTPIPAVSHAILTYNRGRKTGRADGIVITPSHNPPHDGGAAAARDAV